MDKRPLLLVPQFVDRGGLTAFTIFEYRDAAVSTIVREDVPLGGCRMSVDPDGSEICHLNWTPSEELARAREEKESEQD